MNTKKSGEFPVTQKNLDETRAELKADITSVKEDVKSGFSMLEFKIDSKTDSVKADISGLRSEVSSLSAAVHRSLALVEEQSTQNKYVLDGHQSLHDRQDRFEKELRGDVSQIKRAITGLNTTN